MFITLHNKDKHEPGHAFIVNVSNIIAVQNYITGNGYGSLLYLNEDIHWEIFETSEQVLELINKGANAQNK